MTSENPHDLTGIPLYKFIIQKIEAGEDTPEKNYKAYRYHVQHVFGSIVGHLRNQRAWGETPDPEHLAVLGKLVEVVPNVLDYYPEEHREDLRGFLLEEGIIKNE